MRYRNEIPFESNVFLINLNLLISNNTSAEQCQAKSSGGSLRRVLKLVCIVVCFSELNLLFSQVFKCPTRIY